MGNNLEYVISLQDKFTNPLKAAGNVSDTYTSRIQNDMSKITAGANAAGNATEHLKTNFEGLKNIMAGALGGIGITGGLFAIESLVTESAEKAHMLHAAEAQLANTMKDQGSYSDARFAYVTKSAETLSKHINYTQADIVGLESQLRLVGNIGETEMQRMAKASADMATKFHMSLDEAGNAIAKAVNNPEMLRRLGMQLKIDPAIQEHLQNLAKHGKEATARLELLNIVEQKVGGAAEAAFNSDPLAKYKKTVEEMQLQMGKASITLQAAFAPALEGVANTASKVAGWFVSLTGGTKTVAESVKEETDKIYGLYGQLTAVNTSEADRKKILEELKDINPKITNGIDDQSISYSKLAGNIQAVTSALNQQKIADQFRNDNAGMFATYSKATTAYQSQQQNISVAMAKTFSLYPDVAANTNLTIGEKQMEIQRRLKASIAAGSDNKYSLTVGGSGMGYGSQTLSGSTEQDLLMQMQGAIKLANAAADTHNKILPEYLKVTKQIKVATDIANKALGVTDTTEKGKYDATTITGKDKADSINSGGQRSIVINIAKQTGAENIYVGSNKEAAGEIESLVREGMRRVMLSLNGNAVGN